MARGAQGGAGEMLDTDARAATSALPGIQDLRRAARCGGADGAERVNVLWTGTRAASRVGHWHARRQPLRGL